MGLYERLLGSWQLVSSAWHDDAGGAESPFAQDEIGQLNYDASGRMSAQLGRRHQPHFAADDFRLATAEEKSTAWGGYFAYFGTYVVDEEAGVVIHRVEGSTFPNIVGTEQRRRCTLAGNRLTLAADTPWGHVTIVWEKTG